MKNHKNNLRNSPEIQLGEVERLVSDGSNRVSDNPPIQG